MKNNRLLNKSTLSFICSTAFFISAQQSAATLLDPAQLPLILTESVAPNLILTLDDSGSMRWGFVPDNAWNTSATRRSKSSTFNPLYYNPDVTYLTPIKYENNGARSAVQYSTSFTSAFHNGFNTGKGSVNLSTDYKVNWKYDLTSNPPASEYQNDSSNSGSTNNKYSKNPASDFGGTNVSTTSTISNSGTGTFSGSGTNNNISNNNTGNVTINGQVLSIKRLSNTTCSVATNSYSETISSDIQDNVPGPLFTTTTNEIKKTTFKSPKTCSRASGGKYTVNIPTSYETVKTIVVSRADQQQSAVPAYYYVYDESMTACGNSIDDDNCYRLVLVSANSGKIRTDDSASGNDERLNFARWYSFYRNRALSTLSAANLAFSGLPRSIRFTWQNLTQCNQLNSSSCNNNYLRKFTTNHIGNFFNWLPTVTFSGSTPLRSAMTRAGDFIQTSTPWADDPNPLTTTGGTGATVNGNQYACRASYHVMMTDGIWNQSATMPTNFKPDEKSIAKLPDNSGVYGLQKPFQDPQQETLSDLAFHYWATDARTDISNDLKPLIVAPNTSDITSQYWDARNDPATWQHLNTFTVGLGLKNSLDQEYLEWDGDTFSGGYNNIKNGIVNWPPASADSANNVYDLWHAAVNSRGEFFSADTPEDIVKAFADIISRISNRTTSAGAPGVTASIVEDTLTREVYETKFNSEDWSGDLTKFKITDEGIRSSLWNAQSKIPASRNIKMFGANSTTKLVDFNYDNLSPAQISSLAINADSTNSSSDGLAKQRVEYIRGDQSLEGNTTGAFRIRSSVLGDIVNSSPVIVGTPRYISYLADAIDGENKYAAFKEANRAEKINPLDTSEPIPPRRPMVYVGANDGMLHGFDANTGVETFAYVPSAIIPNLYNLTAQRYKGSSHKFFVDGTPSVADVYYDNAWHTVLIGTLRAGGRSIFALDITDPDKIKLLWEKSFADTGLNNLGYTFPQPVIARLHTGKWAVVIGNGYGNQSSTTADKASLMIFDVASGNLERELVVPENSKANGLSSVRLADNNSDGIADYAYAGDLQGNMWRFDLVPSSSTTSAPDPFKSSDIGTINASSFSISYNKTPLYTAKITDKNSTLQSQPITAAPSLVRHPNGIGYLVLFGTGKYFETNDGTVDSTKAMTIYGIWDKKTKRESTTTRTSPTRSNLQLQEITEEATSNPFSVNESVQGLRLVSDNPVDWTTKEGWYLDLKVKGTTTYNGEMLINPMATRGRVLLLNTLTPNSNPCKDGVDSWLYGINPTTGGSTTFNVFDLNNDKSVDRLDSVVRNGKDAVVSAYKKPGSGGFTTNNGDIYTAPSQGSGMKYDSDPTSKGRQSWRIIPEEAQ